MADGVQAWSRRRWLGAPLALAAGARYVALPQADAAALSRAVQGAHGHG
jgi:hypothetical protein